MKSLRSTRKRRITIAVCIGVAAALVLGAITWRAVTSSNEAAQHNQTTPPFQALLPKDVAIRDLGGWQKLTPPDGTSVYVFVDTVDDTKLRVTQQPLPKNLKNNTPAQMNELAKSYNASRSFDADGTKVYIGTSAQGPQSVIFTKNGLLVLVKSDATLPDASWITYVQTLQ